MISASSTNEFPKLVDHDNAGFDALLTSTQYEDHIGAIKAGMETIVRKEVIDKEGILRAKYSVLPVQDVMALCFKSSTSYWEVIPGSEDEFRQIYFDVDCALPLDKSEEEFDRQEQGILRQTLDAITFGFNQVYMNPVIDYSNWMILKAPLFTPEKKKISFHIHCGYKDTLRVIKKIADFAKTKCQYIDMNVYKVNQSFRYFGFPKTNTNNPLSLVSQYQYGVVNIRFESYKPGLTLNNLVSKIKSQTVGVFDETIILPFIRSLCWFSAPYKIIAKHNPNILQIKSEISRNPFNVEDPDLQKALEIVNREYGHVKWSESLSNGFLTGELINKGNHANAICPFHDRIHESLGLWANFDNTSSRFLRLRVGCFASPDNKGQYKSKLYKLRDWNEGEYIPPKTTPKTVEKPVLLETPNPPCEVLPERVEEPNEQFQPLEIKPDPIQTPIKKSMLIDLVPDYDHRAAINSFTNTEYIRKRIVAEYKPSKDYMENAKQFCLKFIPNWWGRDEDHNLIIYSRNYDIGWYTPPKNLTSELRFYFEAIKEKLAGLTKYYYPNMKITKGDPPEEADMKRSILAAKSLEDYYMDASKNNQIISTIKAYLAPSGDFNHKLKMVASPYDFPYVIPIMNGKMINVKTREILPRDFYIRFHKNYQAEYVDVSNGFSIVDDYLEQSGPNELKTLLAMTGYSFTSCIEHRKIFLLYGLPKCGKSMYLNIINSISGSYGRQFNERILTGQGSTIHDSDYAMFRGTRFAFIPDYQSSDICASNITKVTESNWSIRLAGAQYDETFKNESKLWLAANTTLDIDISKPQLKDRFIFFQFKVPTKIIPNLESDIKNDQNAKNYLFSLAINAYLDFEEFPETLLNFTKTFANKNNTVLSWYESCIIETKGNHINDREAYSHYQEWCSKNDKDPYIKKVFLKHLEDNYGKAQVGGLLGSKAGVSYLRNRSFGQKTINTDDY